MKTAIRTFALTLVVTGIVAGTYAKRVNNGSTTVSIAAPMPTCPLNSGGCGVWK